MSVSKVCHNSKSTDENGIAVVKFKVASEGRWIGEGETLFENPHPDDVYHAFIEYPLGTPYLKFCDDDVQDYQSGGVYSLDGKPVNLSNLAKSLIMIPGNAYLCVKGVKGGTEKSDTLRVNLYWGY